MAFTIAYLGLILAYNLIAIGILKIIQWATKSFPGKIKLIFFPLIYSFLFGIGIISSGKGNPGFAFPLPILLISIISFFEKMNIVISILIPIVFWTTTIGLAKFFKYLLKIYYAKSK